MIISAIEPMSGLGERSREFLISTAKAKLDSVVVAVQDSSPGLASATLDRIFDAFYTAFDAFYTATPGGLGIGLCRSVIEAHGGRLWAITSASQGAIFNFTLPAYRDSAR